MIESRPHWKEVPGYEGLYEVSDHGAVRSLNYGRSGKRKEMKGRKDRDGYERVKLCRNGIKKTCTVHRIVWEAFNGSIPEGLQIDHINAIRDDNRLENLRVVTTKENANNPISLERVREYIKRRSEDPKWREAQRNAVRKAHAKPIVQIDKVTGEVLREWECAADVERELGIQQTNISKCCRGKLKSTGGYRWQFAPRRQKSTRSGII